MPPRRIELTVSQETWERIEKARGREPRATWIKRAIALALAADPKPPPLKGAP
jgi:hypothetical protein